MNNAALVLIYLFDAISECVFSIALYLSTNYAPSPLIDINLVMLGVEQNFVESVSLP